MSTMLRQLIDRYESAEQAVIEAITNEAEVSNLELGALDKTYRKAFEDLIGRDLATAQDRLERIQYLLAQVEKAAEGGRVVRELNDAILKDAASLLNNATGKPKYISEPANVERAVQIRSMCS